MKGMNNMTQKWQWNDFGQVMAARLQAAQDQARGKLAGIVAQLTADASMPMTAEDFLQAAHRLQRVEALLYYGLADHDALCAALDNEADIPSWKNYAALNADAARLDRLARLLFEGDPERRAPVYLQVHDYTRGIAERVVTRCALAGAAVDIRFTDTAFDRLVYGFVSKEQARAYGLSIGERCIKAGRIISLQSNYSAPQQAAPMTETCKESIRAFAQAVWEVRRIQAPNQFYTLTTVPTPQDAALDGIAYDDYVDLYFRMCELDWDQMYQAHRVLIAKLNAGRELRFTNHDGTDIRMDIDGFTFANSCVAKNVPGSEVFSAPRRDSVNGIIVARGRFAPRDNHEIIENITMEFEDGRLVRASAEKGDPLFQRIINTDEGARYIGEIGIGTNPVLQQHVVNGLLVEKIGGSFHVALGKAYEYTDYLGEPVALDNGNRSAIHWDITTMLVGKEGRIILDGEDIMRDGKFVDPALHYLNGAQR